MEDYRLGHLICQLILHSCFLFGCCSFEMFLERVLGKLANIFQTKDGLSSWLGGFIWILALIFFFLFGKLKFLEVRWPWLSLFFLLSQTSVSALSRSSLSYLAFLRMPGGLGSHSQDCPLVQEAITAIELPWQLLSHFIFAIPSPCLPCDFWQKRWLLSNKTWIWELLVGKWDESILVNALQLDFLLMYNQ